MGQPTQRFEVGCVVSWKKEPASAEEVGPLKVLRETYGDGPFRVAVIGVTSIVEKNLFPNTMYLIIMNNDGQIVCREGMAVSFSARWFERITS